MPDGYTREHILHLQGIPWKCFRASIQGVSPLFLTEYHLLWSEITPSEHNSLKQNQEIYPGYPQSTPT